MPTSPNSVDHNLRRDGNEARREDRPEPDAKNKRPENEHNHERRNREFQQDQPRRSRSVGKDLPHSVPHSRRDYGSFFASSTGGLTRAITRPLL